MAVRVDPRVSISISYRYSDTRSKIGLMSSTLAEIRAANDAGASPPIAGTFVIYNFPDRDCSALASAGELVIAEGGVEAYKSEYIDPIVELVKEYAVIRIIFVFGEYFPHPRHWICHPRLMASP